MTMADENTLLFGSELAPKNSTTNISSADASTTRPANNNADHRLPLFLFLEAKTPTGLHYESFTISLIILSVITFVLSSLYLPEYND